MLEDGYDDFFDSPRHCHSKNDDVLKSSVVTDVQTAKLPPVHPNSRPGSAVLVNKVKATGGCSPPSRDDISSEDLKTQTKRRVIEAKVPTGIPALTIPSNEDDDAYSDDSFEENCSLSGDEECTATSSPLKRTYTYDNRTDSSAVRHNSWHRSDPLDFYDHSDLQKKNVDDDHATCSDDNSDVTDISPLDTPHSPLTPNLTYALSDYTYSPTKTSSVQRQAARQSGRNLRHGHNDPADLAKLLQTVLEMESHEASPKKSSSSHASAAGTPATATRRNYSFNEYQIRAIDRENERLMKSIMRHASEAKKAKSRVAKTAVKSSSSVVKRPASAAINRAKQMQQIEAENLILLRKLQQTRPSTQLRRDVLVSDFERSTRPRSAGILPGCASRPGSGKRVRPQSAGQPQYSRPATAFPSRLDDDDILTWQPGP